MATPGGSRARKELRRTVQGDALSTGEALNPLPPGAVRTKLPAIHFSLARLRNPPYNPQLEV